MHSRVNFFIQYWRIACPSGQTRQPRGVTRHRVAHQVKGATGITSAFTPADQLGGIKSTPSQTEGDDHLESESLNCFACAFRLDWMCVHVTLSLRPDREKPTYTNVCVCVCDHLTDRRACVLAWLITF